MVGRYDNSSKDKTYKDGLRVLPYGQCIWPTLWKHDPSMNTLGKYVSTGITASMLLSCVFVLPSYVISDTTTTTTDETQIEISKESISLAWFVTIFCFSTLCSMDILIAVKAAQHDTDSNNNNDDDDDVWWWKLYLPTSLITIIESMNHSDTHKMDGCYSTMFGELNRGRSRLIRCVGNTYSNALYLWISVILLTMNSSNSKFPVADGIFGIMMLLLAISSTLWHATQLLTVQYVDIWSMEAVIAYLLIRFPCMFLIPNNYPQDTICASIFTVYNVWNAKRSMGLYQSQWLHSICPFAARTRIIQMLFSTSPRRNNSHQNNNNNQPSNVPKYSARIIDFCIFASIPVLYLTLPAALVLWINNNNNNDAKMTVPQSLLNGVVYSLVIGWTYRNHERWILDWFPFQKQNAILSGRNISDPITLGHILVSALFSPTAVFHTLTGITLWKGYCLVLYLDQMYG